ncbi:MAG TPA: hypothetical protein PK261_00365, partial [Accumulibacter sp.]|nr:hypothetical protein [Accumulibacter sp.]
MNPRYALVLASQCHQLPFLPGLDDLARQLHALLGDPRCGDCQPIDNDSGPGERDERDERGEPVDRLRPPPGLLLDPTVGRLAGNALGPAWGMHTTFILIDAILLAAVLFDWKRGQNFRPWLVALGCFLVYQIMAYRLAATWHPFEKS